MQYLRNIELAHLRLIILLKCKVSLYVHVHVADLVWRVGAGEGHQRAAAPRDAQVPGAHTEDGDQPQGLVFSISVVNNEFWTKSSLNDCVKLCF